jgi:hypothetical protein
MTRSADVTEVEHRRGLTTHQTQLPPDYVELEKRVDALKQVHQNLLNVTYVERAFHYFVLR